MTTERLGIVLETVSFFLVTLDLLGRHRLEAWHARLRARLERAGAAGTPERAAAVRARLDHALSAEEWDPARPRWSGAFAGVAAVIGIAAMLAVVRVLFLLGGFGAAPTGWKVLTLTLAAGVGVLGFRYTPHLLWAGLRGADAAVRGALWLLVRLKLEGTLLAVGTGLFLLSKALAWWAAP